MIEASFLMIKDWLLVVSNRLEKLDTAGLVFGPLSNSMSFFESKDFLVILCNTTLASGLRIEVFLGFFKDGSE